MGSKISVVLNTVNNEEIIGRAIKSSAWADEVVVCDMHSEDKTAEVAKKAGARVVEHERKSYVELSRNFNISQAKNDWILILDPDEEVSDSLAKKLQKIAEEDKVSYVEIPRKNIIFGKWMKASMWWPDYNIRFFKKGAVSWGREIHRPPEVSGVGLKLEAEEDLAILHYHYESISQFIIRLDRYTTAQAESLKSEGYCFKWTDIVEKPLAEFLSRYFAHRGFEDGIHGFALGLLQAFSFLVVYLKVWEMEKFKEVDIKLAQLKSVSQKSGKEINYWFKYGNLSENPLKRFVQKAKNKLI